MSITWVTQAGNLGTIEERTITEIQIAASSDVGELSYSIIAGSLPRGLRLLSQNTYSGNTTTGFINGTPVEVSKQTTSRFVIRASHGNIVSDRTFEITINGADIPRWITPEGYLQVGISNTHFVLDNSYVSIQLNATDSDITTGSTLTYRLLPNAGEFPPGLSLDSSGLISGFTEPLFALEYNGPTSGGYDTMPWDAIPLDFTQLSSSGYDTFFYDNVTFDYSDLQSTIPRLNRDYTFSIEVSDGVFSVTRMFRIYVVTDEYLATQNIGVIRKPLWITKPYLGRYRANNYVTILLDVYDPPSLRGTITYFLLADNPDGSASTLPPGMTYDSMTGDIAGYVPYQAKITKSYKFTMLAASFTGSVTDAVIVSSNMDASVNQLIVADTSVMSYQIRLPNNPSNGDRLCIVDSNNTFSRNPVTLESKNAITIENSNALTLDIQGTITTFVYDLENTNWVLQFTPIGYIGEITTLGTSRVDSDYEVIATLDNSETSSTMIASANQLIVVDTSLISYHIRLPQNPSNGDRFCVVAGKNTFDINNLIVESTSSTTIENTNLVNLDIIGTQATFIFDSDTNNWSLQRTPFGYLGVIPTFGITYINGDYNAIENQILSIDSSSASFNIILPALPANNTKISIIDSTGSLALHGVSIIPNTGDTIYNTTRLNLDIAGTVITVIYDTATNNWELDFKPIGDIGDASIVGLTPSLIYDYDVTASDRELVRLDSSNNQINVTLPQNPSDGFIVGIIDIFGNCNTNNITIIPNIGNTVIDGPSLILDINGSVVTLLYVLASNNWELLYIPGNTGSYGLSSTPFNPTLVANQLIMLDSSANEFNLSLPSSPANNTKISIIDAAGSLSLHNVSVIPGSGDTIYNDSSLILDVSGSYITTIYNESSKNWDIISNPVGYLSNSAAAGLLPSILYNYDVTAVNREFVRLDSRNNQINVTLPQNPSNGFTVGVIDIFSNCHTYPITITPNTRDTIVDDAGLILDINGAAVVLIYDALTRNWRLQLIPSNSGTIGLSSTQITPSTIVNDINSTIAISSTLVGEWNSTTTYNVNDAVRYSGFVYVCIVRNSNKLPLNTSYWVSGVATEPRTFTIDIVGEIESAIEWISKPNLGTISPNKPSTIALEAINHLNSGLSYKLVSGNLPSGLILLQSGLIEGKVRQFHDIENNLPGLTRFFDHDSSLVDSTRSRSYNTTFDGNTTTFDRKHVFTVMARDSVNFAEVSQTFELTVQVNSESTFANLYVKAFLNNEQRLDWHKFITDDSIFKFEDLYRYGDPHFGLQTELKALIFAGIETNTAESYVQAMGKNHANKQMLFGEIKTAVALDETTQQPLYEVVYVDLVDQFEKNGVSISKIVNLPDNTSSKVLISYDKITIDSDIPFVSDSDKQRVFPNSIKNMRKQIETTGTRDRTYLPLWMRSIQPNTNHEPGFVRAIVLCYTKPGHSATIASKIKTKNNTASRGNWSPNAFYQTGDTVKYFSTYYTCIVGNSNTKPTDEQQWSRNFDFKLLNFTSDRYIIDTLDGVVSDKYLVFPTHREP